MSRGLPPTMWRNTAIKLLMLDIETMANKVWTWGLFDQNVGLNQVIEPGRVLCVAAKWHEAGVKKRSPMIFAAEWEGVGSREDRHFRMLQIVWELLDEADVVSTYNGKQFDLPWLNYAFVTHGFNPPSPYQQIDLLQVIRRRFRFPSNKLEYVSKALGLGGKIKHEGFDLWTKVGAGDPDAQKRMEKYNRQDTQLVEDLYQILQPWIPGHPNRAIYDGKNVCPVCGVSGQFERRGTVKTQAAEYQQVRCKSCGSYRRFGTKKSNQGIEGRDLRPVTQ